MTPLSPSENLQPVNPLCNNNCYTKGLLAAYYYLLGDKKTVAEVCIRKLNINQAENKVS